MDNYGIVGRGLSVSTGQYTVVMVTHLRFQAEEI
jgi:hypothetical protein